MRQGDQVADFWSTGREDQVAELGSTWGLGNQRIKSGEPLDQNSSPNHRLKKRRDSDQTARQSICQKKRGINHWKLFSLSDFTEPRLRLQIENQGSNSQGEGCLIFCSRRGAVPIRKTGVGKPRFQITFRCKIAAHCSAKFSAKTPPLSLSCYYSILWSLEIGV